MILEVLWKKGLKTEALGRNGQSICTGVEVLETNTHQWHNEGTLLEQMKTIPIVEISPLNSRGEVTRCHIDIPIESIPEVIKKLKKAYQQEKFFVEKGAE